MLAAATENAPDDVGGACVPCGGCGVGLGGAERGAGMGAGVAAATPRAVAAITAATATDADRASTIFIAARRDNTDRSLLSPSIPTPAHDAMVRQVFARA